MLMEILQCHANVNYLAEHLVADREKKPCILSGIFILFRGLLTG